MSEFSVSSPVPVRVAIPHPSGVGKSHDGRCFPPEYRGASGGHRSGLYGATRYRPLAVLAMLLFLGSLSGCAALGHEEPAPVTVPDIIQMSRAGMPADRIIDRMKRSGTTYRLQASQLAGLHRQGVAGSVIDYMQQTYLDAVRQRQEREDQDYWSEVDGWWYGGFPWGWPDVDVDRQAAHDRD